MSYYGKISWIDATGTTQSFTFKYPARQVPGFNYKAVRHDNIASSGVKEAVFERVDKFTTVNMEFVASGSDLTNWQLFIDYAIQGGAFSFFPDSDSSTFTNYTLEDQDWNAAYKSPGIYTFKLTFRQVVT